MAVEIIITADDQATPTLRSVEGAVGTLGKAASGFAKFAAAGLVAVTAAATSIATAGAGLAVAAAPLENVQAAFEGITEAADVSSDAMLGALQDASAGMINMESLMMRFNAAAQLVSVDFAQRLPDAMQHLSKVAASTGESMDFMLDSLIRGVGRLSPMILDNLQVQIDMAAAYDAFAEKVGKATGELSKQEQQMAVMDEVMRQLEANTASLPDVVGSASQKLAAFMTDIKDLALTVGLALLPALKAATDILSGNLAGALEVVGPLIDQAAGALKVFFSRLDIGFTPLQAFRAAVLDFFPPDVAARIIGAAENLDVFLRKVGELATGMADQLAPILEDTFGPQLTENFSNIITSISELWAQHGDAIMATVAQVASTLIAGLGGALTVLSGLVSAGLDVLQGDFQGAWDAITGSLTAFADGIVQSLGGDSFASVLDTWRGNLSLLGTIVTTSLNMAAEAVTSAVGNFVAGGVAIASGLVQGVAGTIGALVGSVIGAVGDAAAGVYSAVGNFVAGGVALLMGVVSGVLSMIGALVSAATSAASAGAGGILGAVGAFASAGAALLQGAISGIMGMVGALVAAAADAAAAAAGAFAGALGIQSPSKVFQKFGQQMMEGLAVGMKGSVSIPMRAATAAAGATAGGFASVPRGIGNIPAPAAQGRGEPTGGNSLSIENLGTIQLVVESEQVSAIDRRLRTRM